MIAAAERTFPDDIDELRHDPLAVLTRWDEVTLQLSRRGFAPTRPKAAAWPVPTSRATTSAPPRSGSRCRPATAGVRSPPSTSWGITYSALMRTLLALSGSRAPRDLFEDLACDEFAAQMLLPDSVVDQSLGDRGPTAHDLVALYSRTSASRSAVCVQAARRLPAQVTCCCSPRTARSSSRPPKICPRFGEAVTSRRTTSSLVG